MQNVRRCLLVALVSTLGFTAATARAAPTDEPGWYVGVSAGEGQFAYAGGAERSTDAYAFHGGYRFNRHFSIEAEYADLGNVGFAYDCPTGYVCAPEAYPVSIRQEVARLDIAAIATVPLNDRFDAFAKLGLGSVRFEQTLQQGLYPPFTTSPTTFEAVYGLGLRLHFDAPWSVNLQWERTQASVGHIDLDMVSLGLEYRFGSSP